MKRIAGAMCGCVAGAVLLAPAAVRAQESPEFAVTGLLRAGLRLESSDTGGKDGFALYDARVGARGRVGIVFDYVAGVEVDVEDRSLRLLDAALSVPLREDLLRLQLGLATAQFGGEATTDKGEIPFVERSQATLALAPGRQIGLGLGGKALEGRLGYVAGVHNGNGPTFENDGNGFLWTARASWNSVGEIEFFEDFVWEVGASLAFSEDSAFAALPVSSPEAGLDRPVPLLVPFTGDRWIFGADARIAWRFVSLAGEYLRADYDPVGGEDASAEGWYLQGGYTLWGAIELLARYDSFRTAAGVEGVGPGRTQFLVLGMNLLPGLYGKLGLQYAIGLDGSLAGPGRALDGTNTGPRLADGQFLLNLQVAF